jgi:hypothetical protein
MAFQATTRAAASAAAGRSAVIDWAHIGDVRGTLGTIAHRDTGPRERFRHRWQTLLVILDPDLIAIAGNNDAGAFGTYMRAGQNYGTSLLWIVAADSRALRLQAEFCRLHN